MTRSKTQSSLKLKELIGAGKCFDSSEVPTYRAVIQQGILLKEQKILENSLNKNETSTREVCKDVAKLILQQWHKSNAQFVPPVVITEKSIVEKVFRFWEKAEAVAWGRKGANEKEKVMTVLDTLFDISCCHCDIALCKDAGVQCDGGECEKGAHIKCNCSKETKLPVLELQWIYYQRKKRGEQSGMRMEGVDKLETEKQLKAERNKKKKEEAIMKRLEREERNEKEREALSETGSKFFSLEEDTVINEDLIGDDDFVDEAAMKEETERLVRDMFVDKLANNALVEYALSFVFPEKVKAKPRNQMNIENTAKASLRCGISPGAAAMIASSFLKDLIQAGHLPEEKSYLVCDVNKLCRARERVMRMTDTPVDEKLTGLGYDGRKDRSTLAMIVDSNGNRKRRTVTEEHVSVSQEPDGKYLTHFVPDHPNAGEKPAHKVAQQLHRIVMEHSSEDSILVLAGDSTSMNTGWRNGVHVSFERLVDHRVVWSICLLHTNELPLRHLIIKIDGPTSSDRGFSGPVCKNLSKVEEMEFDPDFVAIPEIDLIDIPDAILQNMSHDSRQCYLLLQGIKTGSLPPNLQYMKCGPMSHARWTTTGERLLFFWTRKRSLSEDEEKSLETLVKFCSLFYFKLYFEIVVKNKITDGPYHVLSCLRLLRCQEEKVRETISPYVQSEAWFSHSENILLSLLASQDSEERNFAIAKIVQLRAGKEIGDSSVRPRIIPKLNFGAEKIQDMIEWKEGQVFEPIITSKMDTSQILALSNKPLVVPPYRCHTQATERCVKLVTEAAAAVCGQDARDKFIKSRISHREQLKSFKNKQDFMKTF